MMQASSYGAAPQYGAQLPLAGRHRVTTTLWEDEGTLCFQVDVKGVCVARRNDNNMVNGTKLLNVCGMSRGKRDGILKNEKERIVVKVGAMHLKGVWIAFNRAKQLAEQHGIADALYPLFEPNIQSFLYHPDNYPRTAAVMAAAQERHVQRHYASPAVGQAMKDVGGGDIAAGVPLHTGLDNNHWGSASQSHESSGAADSALHYQYQHHSHYQHHASMIPPPTNAGPGMFSASAPHYASQAMPQPVRAARNGNMAMERRAEHAGEQSGASGTPGTLSSSQGGVHRRISGMKRSNEDYMSSSNDSTHHESEPSSQPLNSAPVSSAASVPGNADTFSSNNFTQNFSLDDNMKMTKRPKVTESASQPSLPLQTESAPPMQTVYNGEHAVKSNTRTQSQTD
ncbi:hypothetical protein MVES_001194 [Malassezia vespertilionis]|uniref:HTH APSES-type domain-containing protein n=2 Tax=Malassezia vespertilionis TaxID=2020962 RepID=A0A2N1JE60_9BASI|nr:hypothetical protein MVES_001194 [Malassezia vespertilionis]